MSSPRVSDPLASLIATVQDELGMRERSYTHDLFPGIAPPTVYFQEPLVAEVFGDRFSKDPGCKVSLHNSPLSSSLR